MAGDNAGADTERRAKKRKGGPRMESLLLMIGRVAGIAGLIVSGGATLFRVTGAYHPGGFQVGTLLLGGITAMLAACLLLLLVLTQRPRR